MQRANFKANDISIDNNAYSNSNGSNKNREIDTTLKSLIQNTTGHSNSERSTNSNKQKGDVNEDGTVDYEDSKLLYAFIHDTNNEVQLTDEQQKLADVSGNGYLGIEDLAALDKLAYSNIFNSIQVGSSLKGDFNNDGIVNKKDESCLIIATEAAHNGEIDHNNAIFKLVDLNGDGNLDNNDLSKLRIDILHEAPPDLSILTGSHPSSGTDLFVGFGVHYPDNDSRPSYPSIDIGTNLNGDHVRDPNSLACLLMVARMFGVAGGGEAEAREQIELLRLLSGAMPSEYQRPSLDQLAQGAQAIGLGAEVTQGNTEMLTNELNKGNKVLVEVNFYREYDRESYASGEFADTPMEDKKHRILVTKAEGDNFIIYDPFYGEPVTISSKLLALAMNDVGNKMVVITKPNSATNANNTSTQQVSG